MCDASFGRSERLLTARKVNDLLGELLGDRICPLWLAEHIERNLLSKNLLDNVVAIGALLRLWLPEVTPMSTVTDRIPDATDKVNVWLSNNSDFTYIVEEMAIRAAKDLLGMCSGQASLGVIGSARDNLESVAVVLELCQMSASVRSLLHEIDSMCVAKIGHEKKHDIHLYVVGLKEPGAWWGEK